MKLIHAVPLTLPMFLMSKIRMMLGLGLFSITLLAIACTGNQGPVGPAGPQGEHGPAGETGAQGAQASAGATGAPGAQGPAGATGAPGAQGPAGATGAQGPAGATGEPASTDPADLAASGSVIDAMVHPMSQALTDAITGGGVPFSGADELIALLDEANVEKAVMMSLGILSRFVPDDTAVSFENDFVAGEVAKFPDRLSGFCGINPLFPDALVEIDRCLGLDGMVGIKLGPPFSGVDLTNPAHVAALSAVFDEAEDHRAPVQMHGQTPFDPPLDSVAFENLAGIIAAHPDVRVSYSHCGGVMDPRTSGQWLRRIAPNSDNPDSAFLDLSQCLKFFLLEDATLAERERIVWLLRTWGIDRLIWSTDHIRIFRAPRPVFQTPKESLETLSKYPFTQAEIDLILSGNTASAWLNGK